ncbi:hypothetical protein SAMN00808754_0235 [Thermanaeromonas toyohensis ToBE]|uniref:Uncharacterized protein n=1 Tax=Thermanaeromonas toyohensis ToBE TaxID=698762 RepID=A0A1W1V945_9FIRM|nr:hypothetical protein [Thermanaeromonas toyohensis]SMB89969.1 hypothetical protein SAMN00808754_0235 [Thermanaeromonas toyohensis ToBE]
MNARPLTWRDYYQVIATLAYLGIGITILLRAHTLMPTFPWIVGGTFLAFSLYRLYFIWRYFRSWKMLRRDER